MSDADSLKENLGENPGLLDSAESLTGPLPGTPTAALASGSVVDLGATDLDATAAPQTADDQGWQTVDFPEALRVDEIPHQVPASAASPSAPPWVSVTSYEGLVQHLQLENGELRDRIARLEEALALSQLSARAEILHAGDTDAAPSFAAAIAEPSQSESEWLQQATHRQQILVETLNEQLHSSQERIAQLEQECALIQQRFNDQVQQRLHSETTCRDLRTRLHRQQQQALQFKTALEKCLEMPAPEADASAIASAAPPLTPQATLQALSDPILTNEGAISLFVPKTSPVRPWSQQVQHTELASMEASKSTEPDLPKLPKLMPSGFSRAAAPTPRPDLWSDATVADRPAVITPANAVAPNFSEPALEPTLDALSSDLTGSESTMGLETRSEAGSEAGSAMNPELLSHQVFSHQLADGTAHSLAELVNAIFPAVSSSQPGGDTSLPTDADILPATQPIFDISPFMASAAQPLEAAQDVSAAISETLVARDVSGAIAPENSTAVPEAEPPTAAPAAVSEISAPSRELAFQDSPLNDSLWDSLSKLMQPSTTAKSAANSAALEKVRAIVQDSDLAAPSPSHELHRYRASESIDSPVNGMTTLSPAGPSPILYPLRPTKKLKSLAAVDLPTFPRR